MLVSSLLSTAVALIAFGRHASAQTGVYDLGTVESEALAAHNNLRATKGGVALTWNATLVAAAQAWAGNCVFEDGGLAGTGSNVAASSSNTVSTTDEIGYWIAEESQYNEVTYPYSHYTQMVWKATTQLGCAFVECNPLAFTDGSASWPTSNFLSCLYYPEGNVYPDTNFAANVEP